MKSLVVAVSAFSLALGALAQETSGGAGQPQALQTSEPTPQAGQIFRPESSRPQAGGVHTTYVLRSNDGSKPLALQSPSALNPTAQGLISPLANVELAETPQSLGCIYVGSPASAGCIPNYSSGSGGPTAAGYGAIALVDAYDIPMRPLTWQPLIRIGVCSRLRS